MSAASISAVLITLNAASGLEKCLAALKFCDEILLVDSGSTDATLAIAKRYGARVIQAEWRGFGAQKQFAVEQAMHDWVLCVDADEEVTPRLAAHMVNTLQTPHFRAYRFARCNRFMGRFLRHGEGYPDWSLRLFDRRCARWSADAVHEKVLTDAPVGELAGDLLHDSAQTLEAYLAKQNRYTTLAAELAVRQGKAAGWPQLVFAPLMRFIKFYFLRRGFLDGLPGLVHILIGCHNSFAKYAKMIALRQERDAAEA